MFNPISVKSINSLQALLLLSMIGFIAWNTSVYAADNSFENAHKVHFEVTQTTQTDNDELIIRFNTVADGDNAQQVTREINQAMQAAMRVIDNYPEIISKTEHYSVYPVYVKQTIKNWRGKQVLSLSMQNKPKLLKAVERLQDILNYQSMQFSVSEQRQQKVFKHLQSQAITKFRNQAQAIANDFGARDFKIINTQIRRNQNHPRPYPMMAQAEAMSMDTRSAPVIESGQSDVSVFINGTIVLLY